MSMDWMVQDALQGRISCGKSKKGDASERISLELPGRMVYQWQQFLEDEIRRGGDFFRIRWLVLFSEEIRKANAQLTENH